MQKLQILCNPPCLQAERRGGDSWGHQEHHSGGKLYFAPASDKIQYASQWYTMSIYLCTRNNISSFLPVYILA